MPVTLMRFPNLVGKVVGTELWCEHHFDNTITKVLTHPLSIRLSFSLFFSLLIHWRRHHQDQGMVEYQQRLLGGNLIHQTYIAHAQNPSCKAIMAASSHQTLPLIASHLLLCL